MKNTLLLTFGFLILNSSIFNAQNIHGVVNHYASVSGINGQTLTVNSATAFAANDKILLIQMQGAEIDTTSSANFGDILSTNQAGVYDFLHVLSVSGKTLIIDAVPTNTYQVTTGAVQIVRIPKFCNATVVGSLTCLPWNGSVGGILAFEAATLTLNSNIDVSGKGFRGGALQNGQFNCTTTKYKGTVGVDGAKKGESISNYIVGYDGGRGKQANGGGGGNPGNSGGGGGANAGFGGFGGHEYDGCGISDERGIGGTTLTPSLNRLTMGGGGGAGYRDNNMTSSAGGNGGGIVYINANQINGNNFSIASNGGSVTIISDAESGGGGGAGGSVYLACNNIVGNLNVSTHGGTGGSNYNNMFVINCHGTGGGGGGGVLAHSGANLPSNVTYSSLGGAAGIITNSASTCYSTTYGASNGSAGAVLPNLPASLLSYIEPTLSISGKNAICLEESVTLIGRGASTYKWSNGSTDSLVVLSPTTVITVTLSGQLTGTNACTSATQHTITVAACTHLEMVAKDESSIQIYPNPFNNELIINGEKLRSLLIFDELGKLIVETEIKESNAIISLNGYGKGIYFAKIISESGIYHKKLVKVEN